MSLDIAVPNARATTIPPKIPRSSATATTSASGRTTTSLTPHPRPPPPRLRARLQLRRRAPRRVLQEHPGRRPARRRAVRRRRRPRHPRRGAPDEKKSNLEVVMTIVGAGGKFDNKAYKSSAGLHGMGAKAVTALERSRPSPRSAATASSTRWSSTAASCPSRSSHGPGHPHRDQDHLLAGPGDLRRRHLRVRHPRKPAPRAGLPQPRARDHAEGRAHRESQGDALQVRGRRRRVRHLAEPQRRRAAPADPHPPDRRSHRRGRQRRPDQGRGRLPVHDRATTSGSAATPTTNSTRTAAPT